jgi:hypothetical protein
MASGVRILNTDRNLVIDDNFANYAFVSKHTLTFSSNNSSGLWTGGSAASAVLSLPNLDQPIAFARGAQGWVLAASGKVGVNWVFHFSGGTSLGTATTGSTIEVFVFDRPRAITGAGFGLRTWDAQGRQVFDSRHKYMRVLGDTQLTVGLGAIAVAVPGVHAQLVSVNAAAKSLAPTIPEYGAWLIRCGFLATTTTGYTASLLNYAEGSYNPVLLPPFSPSSQLNMRILTIDVSEY